MNKTQNRQIPEVISYILRFFALMLLILDIAIPILMVGPKLFDYQPYIVISSSMEPTLAAGDVVYVAKYDPTTFQSGDIVCFYASSNNTTPTTHRVVENDIENYRLKTKGDANTSEDLTPVDYTRILGKVVFCIPKIGYLFTGLKSIYGKILYVLSLVLGIVLYEKS